MLDVTRDAGVGEGVTRDAGVREGVEHRYSTWIHSMCVGPGFLVASKPNKILQRIKQRHRILLRDMVSLRTT